MKKHYKQRYEMGVGDNNPNTRSPHSVISIIRRCLQQTWWCLIQRSNKSEESRRDCTCFHLGPRIIMSLTMTCVSSIILVVTVGLMAAVGWLIFLSIFTVTYTMFAKSMTQNYPPEGRKPTKTWPSDIPPWP
jgi:hypothetical protein